MQIEIWHPINGKWTHIVQITENNIRQYLTDGVLMMTKEINEDGTVKAL